MPRNGTLKLPCGSVDTFLVMKCTLYIGRVTAPDGALSHFLCDKEPMLKQQNLKLPGSSMDTLITAEHVQGCDAYGELCGGQ